MSGEFRKTRLNEDFNDSGVRFDEQLTWRDKSSLGCKQARQGRG